VTDPEESPLTLVSSATSTARAFPEQPLDHLDTLWIQVAGTLCNLECTHCFVSSGPGNRRHALLSRAEVRAQVADGLLLGVKEFYFTGGEPFLHPEMLEILADTLAHGPCTVLTNGTLFTTRRLEALRDLDERSRYAFELRVSLDGPTAAAHDRFRGAGSFALALEGLRRCAEAGLLPIVTVTHEAAEDTLALRDRYMTLLRAEGIRRPRVKMLPMFRIGREAGRTRGYLPAETLADLPRESFDPRRLQCSSCRAVTSHGVFVCPLLVDEPGARMGDRLGSALGPFRLVHGACHTCYVTGMTCANG
jgi:molybdenum cofactor biosynthesis enzyme MoaA